MVNYSTGGKYYKEKFSQNEGTFIFLLILKKSSYIKMKSIRTRLWKNHHKGYSQPKNKKVRCLLRKYNPLSKGWEVS